MFHNMNTYTCFEMRVRTAVPPPRKCSHVIYQAKNWAILLVGENRIHQRRAGLSVNQETRTGQALRNRILEKSSPCRQRLLERPKNPLRRAC